MAYQLIVPILMAGARTRLAKKAVKKALEWYKIDKKNKRILNKQKQGKDVSGKEYTEFAAGKARQKVLRSDKKVDKTITMRESKPARKTYMHKKISTYRKGKFVQVKTKLGRSRPTKLY
tara:strand:- start:2290 stop:2646 length:357 start_codon:yes stop_codon:yes gene_type:complete